MDMTDDFDHPPPPENEKAKLTAEALATHDGPSEPKHDKDKNGDASSESDLSEIDDNVFKDYSNALPINDRPVVPIDEEAVAKLGVHRRQRDPNDVTNNRPTGPKRTIKRRRREGEDEEELRSRSHLGSKKGNKSAGSESVEKQRPLKPLTVEEQRIADLDAKIGEALKSKAKRRKRKDEEVCSFPSLFLPLKRAQRLTILCYLGTD